MAEKDGIKYQFLPDRVIKFDGGEHILKYAHDNIQVIKTIPLPIEAEDSEKSEPSIVIIEQTDETVNSNLSLDIPKGEHDITDQKTKPKKETITKQQKLKEAVDKKKVKAESPIKDGIYLLEEDYTNAWRYVDENTAVPLKLSLEGNEVVYKGDMTTGVEKSISQGYLLDDQFIQAVPETYTTDQFKQDLIDSVNKALGDLKEIIEDELFVEQQITKEDIKKDIPLPEDNLTKFLNNEPIPDILRQVLEWRSGKGLTIDC